VAVAAKAEEAAVAAEEKEAKETRTMEACRYPKAAQLRRRTADHFATATTANIRAAARRIARLSMFADFVFRNILCTLATAKESLREEEPQEKPRAKEPD
jgi:chromosomal replication initiation ATPase DnaA